MLKDFTLNIYGDVTYDDGSKDEFAVEYARGIFIGPDPRQSPSTDAFRQLYADKKSEVDAILALLPGVHTLIPAAPVTNKNVTDYTFNLYGLIAYADNTKSSFRVTRDKKAGNYTSGPTTGTLFTKTGSRPSLGSGDTGTTGLQEDGATAGGQSLAVGDVIVNGTDICSTGALSEHSTTGSQLGGAKDIAARINSLFGTIGASAATTFKATDIVSADSAAAAAGAAVVAGSIDTTSNVLTINGTNIAKTTAKASDSDNSLITAINAVRTTTGVNATLSSGVLVLTAIDGRDIVVTTTGTAGNVCFGLGSGKNVTNLRCRGTVTLVSKSAITLTGTGLAKAGLSAATATSPTFTNTLDYIDILFDESSSPAGAASLNTLWTNLCGGPVSIQP